MKRRDLLRVARWSQCVGLVLFTTALCLTGLAQAQQCKAIEGGGILSLTEVEQDGKRHPDVLQNQPAIIDINSSLRITINKDSLRSRTAVLVDTTILYEQIAEALALQRAAGKGLEAMPRLQAELEAWATDPENRNLDSLRSALQAVGNSAVAIANEAAPGSALRDRLNTALLAQRGVYAQYQAVLEAGATEAARLRSQVDALLNQEGVYFQMGAWIATSQGTIPLHLPGFDDYPVGDTSVVERFNVQITESQIAQLETLQTNALQLNTGSISGIFNTLKSSAPAFFAGIIGRTESSLAAVDATLTNALDEIDAEVASVRQTVQQTKTDATNYLAFLGSLKDKYLTQDFSGFGSLSAFISSVNQDWDALKTQTNGLVAQIDSLVKLPEKFAPGSPLSNTLMNIAGVFTPIRNTLTTDISDTSGNLQQILSGLAPLESINVEALAFGEEVLKLDINTLPEQTEVSLLTSGARSPGDGIIIKLAAGQKDQLPCDLETPQIQIYRVSSFLKTVGGLIYTRSFAEGRSFEFGPAYNVLFSWGSRTHPSINTLWRPGVGLNLAALDYDDNEAPELGIGLVFSFLRDYIQFGGGVNVQEEEVYGFFGLSLPLPSSTIPTGL